MKLNVDPNLVVPDDRKSLADGAIEPWAKSTTLYYAQTLASLAKHYEFSLDEKWKKLSLIHISEPTRQAEISYAVFCL